MFNLFQRPSRMVFLDDDAFFLDVLSMALPKHWRADLFVDTQPCIAFLQANGALQKRDVWRQQAILAQSRAGDSLIPLVLQYWQHHPERYSVVELAIFDYAMPGLSGLEALKRLTHWEGRRALLTGQADEVLAVAAFNAGTIHQFIPKQSANLRASLIAQLQPMLDSSMAHHQVLWRQGLTQAQLEWLSDPKVATGLQQWLAAKDSVEYVVTDVPFGVLMVSRIGKVSWLQLEAKAHLEDLVELASEDMPISDLRSVLKGETLPNVELSLALGGLPLKVTPAFEIGDQLLAVSYDLGETYDLAPEDSYSAWCTQHAGTANFKTWYGAQ